jgi:ribose transport system permease protein
MTLGAIIGGNIVDGTNSYMVVALVAVLASCFLIGVVNGVGVTTFNVPPLVMTLAMGGVVRGIILYITRGAQVGTASPFMVSLVNNRWFLGIPGVLFLWAAFTAIMIYLLRNTRYGISLFAIGANEPAARLSGVAVKNMKVVTFGLSSLIAGFTGFLMLGFTKTVYNTMGDWYTLPSVIAVVIGGTALSGGIGGYSGTVAGAIVLILLRSLLTTLNIPEFGREIIFGLVLVGLMFAYGRQKRLRA